MFKRRAGKAVGALALACAMLVCCSACSPAGPQADAQHEDAPEPVEVCVASLKGPTSIGLVGFMDKAEGGAFENDYEFSISGTADEILPRLAQGDIDIALVPANVASIVYNKTDGGVAVIDINTLGVLSVVSGDEGIRDFSDLAGKNVLMTGKGTTPEYVMEHLLEQAGIADSVTLEFKAEATEVAAILEKDPAAIAVLPQPYATSVCVKNEALAMRVDLTAEWNALQDNGSALVTGVTVANKQFMQAHPQAIAEFMEGQSESVRWVNDDAESAAELVARYGIIENASIARKAIPACNLVFVPGDDMERMLSGYLGVLYAFDPASIGGSLPHADFYYRAP